MNETLIVSLLGLVTTSSAMAGNVRRRRIAKACNHRDASSISASFRGPSTPEGYSCDDIVKKTIATSAIALCGQIAFADADASVASTPAPDKSQYTVFNATPVDLRRPYNTDRPSKTDSPYTVDAGVFQVESDVANWTLDYEQGVRTRIWMVGNTNFKIGLTNWMDFQVFPQFYVNTRTSGPASGKPVEHDGFGDTTVRLKISLLGNDGGKLAVGFVSSIKIPTNTDDTGNHVWEPGFGLPVNYSLPCGFTFFGQTRIDILDQTRSSNMRVQWQNPIGFSRTVVGSLSGYVEFYNAVSTGHGQQWGRYIRYRFDLSSNAEFLRRRELVFRAHRQGTRLQCLHRFRLSLLT